MMHTDGPHEIIEISGIYREFILCCLHKALRPNGLIYGSEQCY